MRTNKFREAFKESANLAGLAGAFAVSAAMLNPIPLLIGAAAEVAYLLFVPDSRWYDSRLSKRFDDEVIARRKALKDRVLPTLRATEQERFSRLEGVRNQITTQSQDEQQWFREVLRKLDYLLEKFLLFAGKEAQFRLYLESLVLEVGAGTPTAAVQDSTAGFDFRTSRHGGDTDRKRKDRGFDRYDIPHRDISDAPAPPSSEPTIDLDEQRVQDNIKAVQAYYSKERERVEELLKTEQDEDTKAVLVKRSDVLQRRIEYVGKIGKILGNLNHQLRLVEETFGLINDEIRARSPEQILADIEEVVIATESMTETLEDLASYENMAARFTD